MNVEQEIRELRQRVGKAETRLAALEGQFEFISGQLREVQRYMHTQFDGLRAEMREGFATVDKRFGKIEADVAGLREDLPGIVADAVRSGLRPG